MYLLEAKWFVASDFFILHSFLLCYNYTYTDTNNNEKVMKFTSQSIDSNEPKTITVSIEEFEKSYAPYMEFAYDSFVSRDGISTLHPEDDEAKYYMNKLFMEDREWQRDLDSTGTIHRKLFDMLAKPLGGSFEILNTLSDGKYFDTPEGRAFVIRGQSETEKTTANGSIERRVASGKIAREKYCDALGITGQDGIIGTVGREDVDVLGWEGLNVFLVIDRTRKANSIEDIRNRKIANKVLVLAKNYGMEGDEWGGDRHFSSKTILMSTDFDYASKMHDEISALPENNPDENGIYDDCGIKGGIVAGVASEKYPTVITNIQFSDYQDKDYENQILGNYKTMVHKVTNEHIGVREVKSSHIKRACLDKSQKAMYVIDKNSVLSKLEQGQYKLSKESYDPETQEMISMFEERIDPKAYRNFERAKNDNDLDFPF